MQRMKSSNIRVAYAARKELAVRRVFAGCFFYLVRVFISNFVYDLIKPSFMGNEDKNRSADNRHESLLYFFGGGEIQQ